MYSSVVNPSLKSAARARARRLSPSEVRLTAFTTFCQQYNHRDMYYLKLHLFQIDFIDDVVT